MFRSSEMSLILLSKLFIFLENFLPLCFCYLKVLVAVKLKQTKPLQAEFIERDVQLKK